MTAKEKKEKPDAPEGETVVVNKAELTKVLERLERLETAADKGRLASYDSRFFQRGPNVFTLSVHEGKVITGWRTLKNVSYKDPQTGRLIEDQQYELIFHDNTKEKVNGYERFSDIRFSERIKVEEVSRTQDEHGTTLTVKVIDSDNPFYGKQFAVDIDFVN